MKEVPGPVDLKGDQPAEAVRDHPLRKLLLRVPEPVHVLPWYVDPAHGVVPSHVLPEVRELQGCTGEVGESLALLVAVAAHVKHEPANGVRRVVAVVLEITVGRVPLRRLVHPVGLDQPKERLPGDVE